MKKGQQAFVAVLVEMKPDVVVEVPDSVAEVLEEFADMMPPELLKELPPRCVVDHKIELEPGARHPAKAPYRNAQDAPAPPRTAGAGVDNSNAHSGNSLMAKAKFERTKPHCNVGTIGHVDHGKTTLTAALTKVSADRGWTQTAIAYDEVAKASESQGRRDPTKILTIATSLETSPSGQTSKGCETNETLLEPE